jgi:hypothetical protein
MTFQFQPPRFPWDHFPDVLIHAEERAVKFHPDYRAAKSGDAVAAGRLVADTLNQPIIAQLSRYGSESPILVSAHAYEAEGVNAIPEALADELGNRLDWPVESNIVQINVVGHTGADGFTRLARQAAFDGEVKPGAAYVLVDDFVGQGGTLANLRGHVLAGGGRVLAVTALTGKPYSARLALDHSQLVELREKHGSIEPWWETKFGHSFDCLTQSEARYLARTPDADAIRNRLAAAEQA